MILWRSRHLRYLYINTMLNWICSSNISKIKENIGKLYSVSGFLYHCSQADKRIQVKQIFRDCNHWLLHIHGKFILMIPYTLYVSFRRIFSHLKANYADKWTVVWIFSIPWLLQAKSNCSFKHVRYQKAL